MFQDICLVISGPTLMVCVHQQMRADKQAQARRVKASIKAMHLLQTYAPPPPPVERSG